MEVVDIENLDLEEVEIQSISSLEDETFDIEVEDVHHYILDNGIISHNSAIFAFCVSNGIEPVFLLEYIRWVIVNNDERRILKSNGIEFCDPLLGEWFETKDFKFTMRGDEQILKGNVGGVDYEIDKNRGLIKSQLIEDYGWKWVKDHYTEDEIKKLKESGAFATTDTLTIKDHIETLKLMASYTNQAISKTVNVPNNYPYEDFKKLYLEAWKNGIKGITTYRAGTMTAVLESTKTKEQIDWDKRPSALNADIYSVKVKGENFVIAIGLRENETGQIVPYEIFGGHMNGLNFKFKSKKGKITKQKSGVYALEIGEELSVDNFSEVFKPYEQRLFRLLSMGLRLNFKLGLSPVNIIDQIEKAKEDDLTTAGSAASRILAKYVNGEVAQNQTCPSCSSKDSLVYQEGCIKCKNCGYSKCS